MDPTDLNLPIEHVNILGVPIAAVDLQRAVDRINLWIDADVRTYVTVTGVHGIMESQGDSALLEIHRRAGMCVPDGMPTVWLGWLDGHRTMDRVYGPELMLRFLEQSVVRGTRHYFYGGAEGVSEQLRERMVERFPGLRVVGTRSPLFRPMTDDEEARLRDELAAVAPDVIWVGLSTPKQERWMDAHVGDVEAKVLIGVGAAFDFHTGRVRQAPRPVQRAGLEWAFRTAMEPRRLWRRYLYNNPRFIYRILQQHMGLRIYTTDPETKERT
ncbi:MAG: WecB/TagA/CpsF family glycosyltransferase [Pseudomonadota bacterium]